MLPAIRAHGLDDFLFGTIVRPPALILDPTNPSSLTPNPALTSWLHQGQFLVSWLVSSIFESMFGHVIQCSSACENWTILEQLFSLKSKVRILQLRFLLQATKKGSNIS